VTHSAVTLRPVTASDLWIFERQADDPEFGGMFNWSGFGNKAAVRQRFDRDGWLGADDGRLVVQAGPEVAGNVSWLRVTYGMPGWWSWNVGIALRPEFRGRGIGVEAQLLLVDYLFDTTTVERIEAFTDIENESERRALEKTGFRPEGTIRSAQFRQGRWHDLALYSILRAERRP
jgi:RimJ/RimL family protein N-acetyltransferase